MRPAQADALAPRPLAGCGMTVLEYLVKLLNLRFDMGVVPMDWRVACIVPLYKGKGDTCECCNSKGISLFSVVGKLYVCRFWSIA